MKKKNMPGLYASPIKYDLKQFQKLHSLQSDKFYQKEMINSLQNDNIVSLTTKDRKETKKILLKLIQQNNQLKKHCTNQQKQISLLKIQLSSKDLAIKDLEKEMQLIKIRNLEQKKCFNQIKLPNNGRLAYSEPKRKFHGNFQKKSQNDKQKNTNPQLGINENSHNMKDTHFRQNNFRVLPANTEFKDMKKKYLLTEYHECQLNIEDLLKNKQRKSSQTTLNENNMKNCEIIFDSDENEFSKGIGKSRIQKIISEYRVEKSLKSMFNQHLQKIS